ncbi:MAG: hypothetical protein PVI40_00450 [Chlamydiota bacterium]|jgi:hypothetical protein
MSVPATSGNIVSEDAQVVFKVRDQLKVLQFEEAFQYIQGLSDCLDNIAIKDVVASRSIVILGSVVTQSNPLMMATTFRNEHKMWAATGPFTSEQFLKMMQYERGISSDAWGNFLEAVAKNEN